MRPHPKPVRDFDEDLRAFVRQLPCIICGQRKESSEVSHVRTRGAGGDDTNNVLPMCRIDHAWFEDLSKINKRKLLPIAWQITAAFRETQPPMITRGIGRDFVND